MRLMCAAIASLIWLTSYLSYGPVPGATRHATASAVSVHQAPNSTRFYRSLAAGIGAAKGEMLLKLREGPSVTRVDGTLDIQWFVQPGTQAKVKLNYVDGPGEGWKSLSMNFGPRPLVISFRAGRVDARRSLVSRIDFRKNGEPLEYYDDTGHPIGLAFSQFPEIRQHLKIPNGPASLFQGRPFAGLTASPLLGGGGLAVRQVLIPAEVRARQGALVKLRPQAVLNFMPGRSGGADPGDFVRLLEACELTINTLSYSPDEGQVEGSLGPATLVIDEGHLGASDTVLKPGQGSALHFDRLSFNSAERPGVAAAVIFSGGSLVGTMRGGSRIEIARNARGASLVEINTSEPVRIGELSLRYGENLISTMAVDGAVIPVAGARGQISFDEKNFLDVRFQSAPLSINLARATWEVDVPSQLSGSIPAFTSEVLGGQLTLNDKSRLRLNTGQVVATGASLQSPAAHPAQAIFTDARFVLARDSVIGVSDQLLLTANDGALIAADGANPLSFGADRVGPSGRFRFEGVSVAGGALKLGRQGEVAITSGAVSATLVRPPDSGLKGTLSGTLGAGAGSLTLDAGNAYAVRGGSLRVEELSLSDAAGVAGSFASASFSLGPSRAGFSDKLTIATSAGGTFSADSTDAPLTISQMGELTGNCLMRHPIRRGLLRLGEGAELTLGGGAVEARASLAGARPLSGTLKLDVTATSGAFTLNRETVLPVRQGDVRAVQLTFQNPSVLSGPITGLNLQLAESNITLPNALTAVFTSGSALAGGGDALKLELGRDGRLTGTYLLRLPVRRGDMTLGRVGVVKLTGGALGVLVAKEADQSAQLTVSADVSIGGGVLEPLPGTRVTLKGGSSFKARALSVSDSNGITGALAETDLILGAATVRIPGGFIIKTKDGGRLTAKQSTNPFAIPREGSFAQGSFALDLPFDNLYNASDANLQLTDGRVRLPLVNNSDGSITGSDCSLNGTLPVAFSDPAISLRVAVAVAGGTLTSKPGEPALFRANLQAVIPPIPEVAVSIRSEDLGSFFPASLALKTDSATTMTGVLELKGSAVSIPTLSQSLTLDLHLNLDFMQQEALAQLPAHFDESGHPEADKLRWSFDRIGQGVVLHEGRIVATVTYKGDIETRGFLGGCHLKWVYPVGILSFRPGLVERGGQWLITPEDVKFRVDLRADSDTKCSAFPWVGNMGGRLYDYLNGDRIRSKILDKIQNAAKPVPVGYALSRLAGRVKLSNASGTRACFYPVLESARLGDLSGALSDARISAQLNMKARLFLADTCAAPN